MSTWRVRLAVTACVLLAACGSATSPSVTTYAGQWSGTTGQGSPISFMISPAETVTTITLGHNFSSCTGSQTFSNLNIAIAPMVQCIPGPCGPSITNYRAFGYSMGTPLEGQSTQLSAVFVSENRVEGQVSFRGFPDCGAALSVPWAATRR